MASLEEKIDTLTTAVVALTAAIEAGGGSTAAKTDKPATSKADKPAAAKGEKKPKVTAEQVKAAIVNVKDNVGEDEAREIIQKHAGKGKKLADLVAMPAKFEAAMADCEAALAANGEDGEDDAEEDNDL